MLFLPLIVQALALFSSFPLVDAPHLPSHDNVLYYDGTTDVSASRFGFSPSFDLSVSRVGFSPSLDLSVARFGFSPSYDISVARFGFSPSYDLSVSRVGCSPSYALTISHYGSTPSTDLSTAYYGSTPFRPFIIVSWDHDKSNEVGWCVPLVGPIFFFSLVLTKCGSVFSLLLAAFCCRLRLLLCLGLFGLMTVAGLAFVLVAVLVLFLAILSKMMFYFFVLLLINVIFAYFFAGYFGRMIYHEAGPIGSLVVGACLWRCCGFGVLLFACISAYTYPLYCNYLSQTIYYKNCWLEQASDVMVILGNVVTDINDSIWPPIFALAVQLLLMSSGVFIYLLFFFGVRHFFSSPSPAFF